MKDYHISEQIDDIEICADSAQIDKWKSEVNIISKESSKAKNFIDEISEDT